MDIETLYESGYLPERYYNQQNKKSKEENYKRFKISKSKKKEGFIEGMLKMFLYKTMQDLLKELLPKEIKINK